MHSNNLLSQLRKFLQHYLRETIPLRYRWLPRKGGVFRTVLQIGTREYYGLSTISTYDATIEAERTANTIVRAYNSEESIREYLGLPHRNHIDELDKVRDCLRELKKRYQWEGSEKDEAIGLCKIGQFYKHLDELEKRLIAETSLCD